MILCNTCGPLCADCADRIKTVESALSEEQKRGHALWEESRSRERAARHELAQVREAAQYDHERMERAETGARAAVAALAASERALAAERKRAEVAEAKAAAAVREAEEFKAWAEKDERRAEAAEAKAAAAEDTLRYMRDEYSSIGARGCALCVLDNGVFVRSCKMHEEMDALRTTEAVARAHFSSLKDASAKLRADNDEACAQVKTLRSLLASTSAALARARDFVAAIRAAAKSGWHDDVSERVVAALDAYDRSSAKAANPEAK